MSLLSAVAICCSVTDSNSIILDPSKKEEEVRIIFFLSILQHYLILALCLVNPVS